MNVLCDDCLIFRGIEALGMEGPGQIEFRTGMIVKASEHEYRCRGQCGRYYDPDRGYFSMDKNRSLIRSRTSPRCRCDELTVMFIEGVLDGGQVRYVRYRCPRCKDELVQGMPSAIP